jgi:hypothetical protein
MLPIYVLTNDKHLWLLRGFAHLFNTYWDDLQPVTIVGYGHPSFPLPGNFSFQSIAPANYPAERWSDGLIELCQKMESRHFLLLLEDFWLNSQVDLAGIVSVSNWFKDQEALCLDISGTRGSKRQAREYATVENRMIIATPPGTPYQLSYQASFWDRGRLLQVLRAGENPWQSEVNGSQRVTEEGMIVLGTREPLIRYKPVYRAGRATLDLTSLHPKQEAFIRRQGWVNVR